MESKNSIFGIKQKIVQELMDVLNKNKGEFENSGEFFTLTQEILIIFISMTLVQLIFSFNFSIEREIIVEEFIDSLKECTNELVKVNMKKHMEKMN